MFKSLLLLHHYNLERNYKMLQTEIKNSKGQPIVLNEVEARIANRNQLAFNQEAELRNALGYQVDINTLTAIQKKTVEQAFYTVNIADYVGVRVGEGAFSSELLTYKTYNIGGGFEGGLINTGENRTRAIQMEIGVEAVKVPVHSWRADLSYNLIDVAMASRSGNWDIVASKEKARKTLWDLGVQEIAFWGLKTNTSVKGLLTQSGVTANTALITKYISSMTATEYSTLVKGLLDAYSVNSQRTKMPNVFIMPMSDFNGMAAPVSETYPMINKLSYLLDAFKVITGNQNFKILSSAYADVAQNSAISGLNKNRYVLMNNDADTIRLDIPVDFTNTMQNTVNGFDFQSVAYGQFTGVQAYRPQEVLYLDF